ncbi:DUF4865 family protein [Methylobacterium pseudosasicola]|uniref:DUF4865 domain-containing protein n=1 Tax=Methylobacterium pseudosasicola TaxID=582667 RepID=A0A1I4F933_9HYPH|nr:DUF4865 family protein [Methylobacterium pseudosasicola]SFL14478.1 protein of unknown function [Methylobacterium pseudosasicola]
MLVARYRHRLPADYPMDRIRARVAERAPAWDVIPGLVFKAVTVEERARGAAANAYSSLYLWRDAGAAAEFLIGPSFRAVIESFGRPQMETWLPLDVSLGAATTTLALSEETRLVGLDEDLGQLRETEQVRGRDIAGHPGVLATVVGLEPVTWRLTRFTLQADRGDARSGPEVAHLAAPGLAALRGL